MRAVRRRCSIAGTTAPNVMNVIDNMDFIFNCPYAFTDRFSGAEDYFKPNDDLEPDPVRASPCGAPISFPTSSTRNCRWITAARPATAASSPHGRQPLLSLDRPSRDRPLFQGAQAHVRCGAALREGKGYTYTWPEHLGMTRGRTAMPTRSCGRITNMRHRLRRADERRLVPPAFRHRQGGPARLGWHGPNNQRSRKAGRPGEQLIDAGAIDIKKGGAAIPYYMEDPNIRVEFAATLAKEGLANRMNADSTPAPWPTGRSPAT